MGMHQYNDQQTEREENEHGTDWHSRLHARECTIYYTVGHG